MTHRTETETIIHSDNDFATVAYLRIKSATLQEKDATPAELTIPSQIEERFDELRCDVERSQQSNQLEDAPAPYEPKDYTLYFPTTSRKFGQWLVVYNVHSLAQNEANVPIEEEVLKCFQNLGGTLSYDDSELFV